MRLTVQLLKKEFSDESSKSAYLKACKWVATNIISKVEASDDILWSVHRKRDASLPTFVLEVHIVADTTEYEAQFSQAQEAYRELFYNREKIYLTTPRDFISYLNERLSIKVNYKKEQLGLGS